MPSNPFEELMKVKALTSRGEVQALKDYITDLEERMGEIEHQLDEYHYAFIDCKSEIEEIKRKQT